MRSNSLSIFVLADTHNHFPGDLEGLAQGADEIWHLGDVCTPALVVRLENLGPPLTLVRGNCDSNFEWPMVVDLKRHGLRFRLVHIPPSAPPEKIDVVLHAHTHVPRNQRVDGVLFLNPGCVTRPNRGAPSSVARLEIAEDGRLDWELILLR
jgi:putative phosphoesterase